MFPTPIRNLAQSARAAILKRRIYGAFEFGGQAEAQMRDGIFTQRAEAWRVAMSEQAASVGSGKTGTGPNGRDREYLMQLSREDARSIRDTFNRELRNQIDQLYATNPQGDREYYTLAILRWMSDRAAWKDQQISNQNRNTARTYALQRFDVENQVGEARFVFAGPPPAEAVCAGHFQAGQVDRAYVDANPTPIHINCPHWWERTASRVGVPLSELWVGG